MKPAEKRNRKNIFDEDGVKAFAIQLIKIRTNKGYTQSQLAFESGLSLSQIARIETARINPTISTIFILARTLDIQLKELFDFELSTSTY